MIYICVCYVYSCDDPLDEGMATRSSILAWEISWTEEPDGLYKVHRVAESQTLLKRLSMHTYSCVSMFSFNLGKYLEVEFVCLMVNICLFKKMTN